MCRSKLHQLTCDGTGAKAGGGAYQNNNAVKGPEFKNVSHKTMEDAEARNSPVRLNTAVTSIAHRANTRA